MQIADTRQRHTTAKRHGAITRASLVLGGVPLTLNIVYYVTYVFTLDSHIKYTRDCIFFVPNSVTDFGNEAELRRASSNTHTVIFGASFSRPYGLPLQLLVLFNYNYCILGILLLINVNVIIILIITIIF